MSRLPDDRIVPIMKYRGTETWGCGPFRGECHRVKAKKWTWIVWHVWGPRTLGKGVGPSLEVARMACLKNLRGVSGAPGPETNIEVD